MPGSDEDAGTWPSGSILRGLLPRSIFVVIASALSGSPNEHCVEQESLSRGGRINRSTHTDAEPI